MTSRPEPSNTPAGYAGAHRKPRRWFNPGRGSSTHPDAQHRDTATQRAHRTRWTALEIRALGVTTDVQTAASILGLRPLSGYPINARGAFPVPVIKVGGRYRVPVAPILDLFGIPRRPAQS
jgi:hypothetical protein